jgi:hypothetical protein
VLSKTYVTRGLRYSFNYIFIFIYIYVYLFIAEFIETVIGKSCDNALHNYRRATAEYCRQYEAMFQVK